jgi:hypothetical protein
MPVRQIPLLMELLWSKSGVRPRMDVVKTPYFAALERHVKVSKEDRPINRPALAVSLPSGEAVAPKRWHSY